MADDDKTFLSVQEFVGGWIGGICGLVASHPIDTMKVKLQYGKGTLYQTVKSTYIKEGIPGFYRGIGFPATMAGVQNAVFFGVYANVYRKLKLTKSGQNPDYEMLRILTAGMCAGLIQVLATTPVEIIKIRLQTASISKNRSKTGSILTNMQDIYKLKGFRGFYHGFIPTALRDVPSGGLYIGIYIYSDAFLQEYINSYWAHLISGGIAGVLSYAPMTPFDVVKTRMQADSMKLPKYKSVTDCVLKSYAKGGFICFWRGLVPSSLRALVCNSTVFCIYELCITMLS